MIPQKYDNTFCLWSPDIWGEQDQYHHYGDVIIFTIASQITSLTIMYTTVYSDADQSKHQSTAALAFVRGIHRGPVNSPHKWPVTRKIFSFDDVIMIAADAMAPFQYKNRLSRSGISTIKIRRSWHCLILIHGISILVRRHRYTGTGPWFTSHSVDYM